MRLALHGATGHMGQSLVRLSHTAEDVELVGAICAPDDPALDKDVGEIAGIGPVGVVASAELAPTVEAGQPRRRKKRRPSAEGEDAQPPAEKKATNGDEK